MQRRDFNLWLQRSALAIALTPWTKALAEPGNANVSWKNNPFTLGVASGCPRSDSLVFWTRLLFSDEDQGKSMHTQRVKLEVFADEALKRRVHTQELLTDAARAHSVHAQIKRLMPSTDYWYRFTQADASSTVGHARTAPTRTAQVQQLKLALTSCQNFEHGLFVAHQEIAKESLDFVLFLGDYIYESNSSQILTRKHSNEEPKTLAQYRARYEQYKSDPLLQASHAAHAWILMWDDHEVVNDYANDQDRNYTDPKTFLQRRAAAYQAYFEHQPVWIAPNANRPESMHLYDQFSWGQLADIWTLDCRQYRSAQACRDPLRGGGRMVTQCAELDDPHRTMLGWEQERWLNQTLRASKATWKLISQATQISSTSVPAPVGKAYWNDAWDGYPQARKRLLQTVVDAKLKNVVTLGGDVHMNVAASLRQEPNNPDSPAVASEFVGTSITSRGMGEKALATIRSTNSDIEFARSDERGYSVITVTPEGVRCDFKTTAFPAGSENAFKTQASFVVKRNQVGPQPL
jgi:alkaline phosphatase D